jgi:DNA-binding beta-propeller fold protein YncE
VNGISVSRDRVVAADSNNGRLLVFDTTGRFRVAIPAAGLPRGVALTASGRMVVTDAASDAVTLLDASGAPVQALTGGVGELERFVSPSGIAADEGDGLYVADAATGRVFVLRTGEGPSAAEVAAAAASKLLLSAVAALAALLAIAVAFVTVRRSRARVREAGVTL